MKGKSNHPRHAIPAVLTLALLLTSCAHPETGEATTPATEETIPIVETTMWTEMMEATTETEPVAMEESPQEQTEAFNPATQATSPTEAQQRGQAQQETTPPETTPPPTEVAETTPPATDPPQIQQPATEPPETQPPEPEPPGTETTEPAPPETETAATEPLATEAPTPEITYEFKRQVASYAAMYINQYRGSPCTVLSGMSNVAQYRASQLTWNFSHSTADKRAALAYYEYGRYIDATEFGDDASNSYWEADSAEAICAGFKGADAEAMGKYIADMLRNSASHWSYIGSSEYSYMGIGVEYREGSQYGWYACVMVGSVNYG